MAALTEEQYTRGVVIDGLNSQYLSPELAANLLLASMGLQKTCKLVVPSATNTAAQLEATSQLCNGSTAICAGMQKCYVCIAHAHAAVALFAYLYAHIMMKKACMPMFLFCFCCCQSVQQQIMSCPAL